MFIPHVYTHRILNSDSKHSFPKVNIRFEITKKIVGFPVGKSPLKIGFPKLFPASRKQSKALRKFWLSKALIFTGFLIRILVKNDFWMSGIAKKPVILHPATAI